MPGRWLSWERGIALSDLEELISRYGAVWNESDDDRRRKAIAEIWTEDAQYLSPAGDAHGHDELAGAIKHGYEAFISKGFTFQAANETVGHHDVVRFTWDMVPTAGGEAAASGQQFILLADDGRIRCEYQFIDKVPPQS
jgi:hypothetical protein